MARRRKVGLPRTETYKRVDLVVIGVLWMADIFEPWIYGWLDFSFEILFGNDYVNKGKFHSYGFTLLFFKCTLCMVLSVTVDLRNRKPIVSLIGICVASTTPVFAILTIITRSEVNALLSLGVCSMFFVITPLRYALIFNQKLYPSSMQVRKIAAAFEVTKSLSEFLFYLSKPNPKTFNTPVLIVRWVIHIPMLFFLVTLMDVVRQAIARDVPKEHTMKAAAHGILRDIKKPLTDDPESKRKKAMAIYQFLLFVILLLPIATVVIANVILTKVEEKLNNELLSSNPGVTSNQVIDYKLYSYIADLLAIPLIAVIITHFKRTIQTFADYLLLSFGYLFNSAVLIYLSVTLVQEQFGHFVPNQNASLIKNATRDILQPGISIINIISCVGLVKDDEIVTVLLETPGFNYTLDQANDYTLQFPITVTVYDTLFSWTATVVQNRSSYKVSSKIIPNKRFVYYIVIERLAIKQIVHFGAEAIHLQASPVLLVGNGITRKPRNSSFSPTFLLYPDIDNPSDEIILHLPPPRTFLPVPIPDRGRWVFRYRLTTKSSDRLELAVNLEPHTEALVVLADYATGPQELQTRVCIKVAELTPFNVSELVFNETILQTHEVFKAPVSALKGISAAAISVGYLQFLWLESPLRFRTTVLSVVMIGEEIVQYVLNTVITDITTTVVFILTSVVCILGAVHVIVGGVYESRMRRELWYATPTARSA